MIDFETIYWTGYVFAFILFAYAIKDSNTDGIFTALILFPFISWFGVIFAIIAIYIDIKSDSCRKCKYHEISNIKEVYCSITYNNCRKICEKYEKKIILFKLTQNAGGRRTFDL